MTTRLAPHLVKPVPFLYPLDAPRLGAAVRRGRARALRHDRRAQQRARAEAPVPPRRAAGVPRAARRRARRCGAVLRRPGRRRAAHAHRRAHGGPLRRGRPLVHAGGRVRARVRPGGRRRRPRRRGRPGDDASGAGVVLNCTGVWTDEIQALSGGRGRFQVRASKGVHIVVPREKITGDAGLILRTETSVLFVIPWKNHWLIGTTDTDWNLDLAHPAATQSDIDYLLERVNAVLVAPLTHDDIQGVYAGLRPLLAGESEETSALSREHAVARVVPGLISIAGGKYTTYRVMAADAVDAGGRGAAQRRRAVVHRPRAAARRRRLLRDAQPDRGAGRRVRAAPAPGPARARPVRLDDPRRARARAGRRRRCCETVPGAPDYLMAEIRYAVTHEGALHLEDVLTRRTRISIEYPHRGVESRARGRRRDGRGPRVVRRAARRPRSTSTSRGSRPSASRRPAPTTRRPTRSAPLRPRCVPAGARQSCGSKQVATSVTSARQSSCRSRRRPGRRCRRRDRRTSTSSRSRSAPARGRLAQVVGRRRRPARTRRRPRPRPARPTTPA